MKSIRFIWLIISTAFIFVILNMKIFKRLTFFIAFILPALIICGYYLGGWWNFMTIAFAFLLIPLIDYLVGLDTRNVVESEAKIHLPVDVHSIRFHHMECLCRHNRKDQHHT
jgi:hypothetical protein